MSPARARPEVRDRTRLLACAGAAAGAILALASSGLLWQDEYAHLQFSREVFSSPGIALDVWGRPLATLLYAVPSLLGLWAARLVTVALAGLAALWTARAASARGSSPAVAWLAVVAQPVFFGFSFGALPGTLFAALLARFLLEDARGRRLPAAIAVALLPLARVEGVLVVAVYALALARRGERRLALVPLAGLAAWNLAGWAGTGDPLYLLHANPYPIVGSIYPTAGWAYLGRILPVGAGVVVFLLAQAGIAASGRRPDVRHAVGAAVGIFLVLIWGVPLFASTPTPVYLIGFAPLVALFAADGWAWLRANPHRWRALGLVVLGEGFVLVPRRTIAGLIRALAAPVSGWERFSLTLAFVVVAVALFGAARRPRVLAAGLLVAGALTLAPSARPVLRDSHERVAAEAADWHRAHLEGRLTMSVAPDFGWFANVAPFRGLDPASFPMVALRMHPGSVLVWDSVYAAREGGMPAPPGDGAWRELARFAEGGVEFRLLERA